jgi:PAS domain S-box-containing protein
MSTGYRRYLLYDGVVHTLVSVADAGRIASHTKACLPYVAAHAVTKSYGRRVRDERIVRAPGAARKTGMETELNGLIDALPGLVWTTTPDGTTDFINQRWRAYAGLTIEQVGDDGWKALIHPDDMAHAQARWDACLAAGVECEVEARLRRFDGEYRRFEIRTRPLTDATGRIVGWCGINTDIEDHRRSEEALLAQARRFQVIIDGLPAIAALFTPGGRIAYCNKQMLDYLDETFEQVQSKASAYNFHPEDRDAVLGEWAASVQSGQPFDREARLQRADGAYRWHRTKVIPLRNAEGDIEIWYGLSIDVEDTKRAEAAAREHQRRFQSVIDDMPAIVALFAADGPIIFANRRMVEFHGQTLEQMQQGQAGYTFHPDDRSEVLRRYGDGVRTGEPFACDVRLLRSDGVYRWHVVQGFPLRDPQGRVELWCGMFRDIDDARRAEAALAAEKAELHRAYDLLAEAQRLSRTGSFTWDVAADEHNWSDETYCVMGFDPGARVTSGMILGAIHPEDLPSAEAVMARAAQGQSFDLTFRLAPVGGAVKHVHAVGHRIASIPDRFVFIGAVQDVTDSKVGEDALTRARAELAHVARAATLSALTASIAHEVNQPLAGIITNASTCLRMLAADPPNLDGARATAQRTIRDGNRAAEVIQRLRDMFSRKQAATEAVDLNEAAQEVLALSASELQAARIVQRLDFASDLPPVFGDRVQLQQVILNLVLNAADAMRAVDDRPRNLWLTTARHGDGAVGLSVRDEGVGIEPQNAERLFDAFYTTKSEGMGIGLAISRSIIQSHDGRLWAASNGDQPGATFAFSIPLAGSSAPA